MSRHEILISKYINCFENQKEKGLITNENLNDFKSILSQSLDELDVMTNFGKDYEVNAERLNQAIIYYNFKDIDKYLERGIKLNASLIRANKEVNTILDVYNLLNLQMDKIDRFLGNLSFVPQYLEQGGDLYKYDKNIIGIYEDGKSKNASMLMLDTDMLDALHELGVDEIYGRWLHKNTRMLSSNYHLYKNLPPIETANYMNRIFAHKKEDKDIITAMQQFGSKLISLNNGYHYKDFEIKKENKDFLVKFFRYLDNDILNKIEKLFRNNMLGYKIIQEVKSLNNISVLDDIPKEKEHESKKIKKQKLII